MRDRALHTLAGGRLPCVVGLDRAPEMLAEARQRHPGLALVQGDACAMPLRDGAVDVSLFITTLEFVDSPADALAEAMRVSRRGVLVLALNRWSLGGLSRRWGPAARGRRLRHARDLSLPALRAFMSAAAGMRLRELRWASGLVPGTSSGTPITLPLGDVIGAAAELSA